MSVTVTPEAEPFTAQTWTVYEAAWPVLMLVWEVSTLTHSCAWVEALGDGVAVEGNAWHCELVAARAAPEEMSAAAATIKAMQAPGSR